MINEIPPVTLSREEVELLGSLRPLWRLTRSAVAGATYCYDPMNLSAPRTGQRFSEELVHGLVDKGLMVVIQGGVNWCKDSLPFTVIMTPEGEKVSRQIRNTSRHVQVAA